MRKAKKPGLVVPPVVLINHEKLQLAPYNPNVMTLEERDSLRASILKHGLVENFVVQKHSKEFGDLVLIGGHQRLGELRAIRAELGIHETLLVPCVVLDINDAEAMQLNVALNNISGTPDPFKLGEIFAKVLPVMKPIDVLATGYTAEQLQELVKLTLPPVNVQGDTIADFGKSITFSVEFDTVKDRDAAKVLLKALAEERGKKAGKVVLELLKTVRRGKNAA